MYRKEPNQWKFHIVKSLAIWNQWKLHAVNFAYLQYPTHILHCLNTCAADTCLKYMFYTCITDVAQLAM